MSNASSKIVLDNNWIVIIQANDGSIQNKTINCTWKTFRFFNIENNWTIYLKSNNTFQIWQLKNLQSKDSLIRFVTFDFEEEYQKILQCDIDLDLNYFEAWLSIFQDLDDTESETLPFLYRLKKNEEEYVQELLDLAYQWNEERKVIITTNENTKFKYFKSNLDSNWTSYLTSTYTYNTINTMLDEAINNHNIQKILSFLIWLYLNWFIKVDYKNWIVFQIPLLKSLYLHKTIIYKVFSYLQKYFSLSDSQWSVFQSWSTDWEFETMFNLFLSTIFKDSSQYSTWNKELETNDNLCFWWYFTDNTEKFFKKRFLNQKKEEFFQFLDTITWLENKYEFIQWIQNMHIKILKK